MRKLKTSVKLLCAVVLLMCVVHVHARDTLAGSEVRVGTFAPHAAQCLPRISEAYARLPLAATGRDDQMESIRHEARDGGVHGTPSGTALDDLDATQWRQWRQALALRNRRVIYNNELTVVGGIAMRSSSLAKRRPLLLMIMFSVTTLGVTANAGWAQVSLLSNPYEDVVWEQFGQYKANLHTHTTQSDGSMDPCQIVDEYRTRGYHILVLTDHERWTWPWDDFGRLPEELNMLTMPGNEFTRPMDFGGYFCASSPEAQDMDTALAELAEGDTLAVLFHPGDYWRLSEQPPAVGEKDPAEWVWNLRSHPYGEVLDTYLDFFARHPLLVGMEVFNHANNTDDRKLWDPLLSVMMPHRPVWGFANDDAHHLEDIGACWNVFWLQSLDAAQLREAMVAGRFYFVSLSTHPSAERCVEGTPRIEFITHSSEAGTLTIRATVAGELLPEEGYQWFSDGELVHVGRHLDYRNTPGLGSYVRAELRGAGGTAFTNPFGLAHGNEAAGVCSISDLDDTQWRQWRETLALRNRRVIYNNDGDDRYFPQPPEDVEDFLSQRFDALVGTHVDSYFWCVGDGQDVPWGLATPEWMGDGTRIMLDAARAAGMEAVISVRMNDVHGYPYAFKDENRHMLLDPEGAVGIYEPDDWRKWYWYEMDYAHPEVREHKLSYLARICEEYLPDGLELDFMRHPMYFRPGEEAANLEAMTEFIRQVREELDRIGRRHGRPILLFVRVADTPELSGKLGLDAEAWMEEGLVDVLIAGLGAGPFGGYWLEWGGLGTKHGVPVYPAVECFVLAGRGSPAGGGSPVLRGAAANLWRQGAAGIYLFNFFPSRSDDPDEMGYELRRIGDPGMLSGLDKVYRADYIQHWRLAESHFTWAERGTVPCPLPATLSAAPIALPLYVGEDLRNLPAGKTREMRLLLEIQAAEDATPALHVRVNGESLPALPDSGGLEFPVEEAFLHTGTNLISVATSEGGAELVAVDLIVRYH